MLHVVRLIERRVGQRARPLAAALVVASGCALLIGVLLLARTAS